MRDSKRIKPFLKELEKLWTENPDWRFGQLVKNISATGVADITLYNMEENEFLKNIDEYKKRKQLKLHL